MTRFTVPVGCRFPWLCCSLHPVSVAETIFISNEKDNTITAIDGDTRSHQDNKGPRGPRGILLRPDIKRVLVAVGDGDIMDVVDTTKLEVTRQPDPGPDPELMSVDPDGKRIFIANEDDSIVSISPSRAARCWPRCPSASSLKASPSARTAPDRGHLEIDQHRARHRHRHREADCQRAGRQAAARGQVLRRRQPALGLLGGRRLAGRGRPEDVESD